MERKVSLSIGEFQEKLGPYKALDIAKEIGLEYVDFDLLRQNCDNPNSIYSSCNDDEVHEHFKSIKKYADSIGIKVAQTHGRIKGYTYDETFNENEKKSARYDMLASSALGTEFCVIHSVHLGIDAPAEDQRSYNDRMFDDYLPFAKEFGIKIATETFGDVTAPDGRSAVDFFGDEKEYINAYNSISSRNGNAPYFCTCVDTGHTNKAHRFEGEPSPQELIRKLGSSVRCLHLNDNDMMSDQHLIPGAGRVEWNAVFEALSDIGYNGVYNMELTLNRFGKDISISKDYAALSVRVMKYMLKEYYGD